MQTFEDGDMQKSLAKITTLAPTIYNI